MDLISIDLPLSFFLCVFTRLEVRKIVARWFEV